MSKWRSPSLVFYNIILVCLWFFKHFAFSINRIRRKKYVTDCLVFYLNFNLQCKKKVLKKRLIWFENLLTAPIYDYCFYKKNTGRLSSDYSTFGCRMPQYHVRIGLGACPENAHLVHIFCGQPINEQSRIQIIAFMENASLAKCWRCTAFLLLVIVVVVVHLQHNHLIGSWSVRLLLNCEINYFVHWTKCSAVWTTNPFSLSLFLVSLPLSTLHQTTRTQSPSWRAHKKCIIFIHTF